VLVIAPASANTVAKLTHGISDNLLTVVTLACSRPVILAPAMDADMYLNTATQRNIAVLRERGFLVMEPESGELASGLRGPGRLPETGELVALVQKVLRGSHRDLRKKRIVVTAGPTYEAIDPVRFIGNRSSGKMGFAIANAAAQRGADVTLIAGPAHLETPRHVRRLDVESARDMETAVRKHARRAHAVIMAAAVADYMPAHAATEKIKKSGANAPEIPLVQTPDILAALGRSKRGRVLVGFALETENERVHAEEKLRKKNLDLIVLNSLKKHRTVFGGDTNVVTFIDRRGSEEALPELPKFEVANRILDRVRDLL
jgi:phosphopantothenoylcysteine decarboxylase/phosphopantothenate--cysteine ligase